MSIEPASISLIVSTYNRPDALDLVLKSVRSQLRLPLEVLVADDGSGADTAALVEQHSESFPVPLVHVWHEDSGFRLSAIRNKAIAAASGQYIVQIDGDIVLHHHFIRAHAEFAMRGTWVQGSRALLSRELTESLLRSGVHRVSPLARGVSGRINALYIPGLSRLVSGPRDASRRVRGAHMAFWRDDLVLVNGYNEDIEGWGREDSEIATRLLNAGILRRNIKFSAVAYHLWHKPASGGDLTANDELLRKTRELRLIRTSAGLDRHLKPAEGAM